MDTSFSKYFAISIFACAFVAAGIFFLFSGDTRAAVGVPRIISYQGRLASTTSNDLIGTSSGTNYYFRFSLYTAASGGSKVWPSGTPCTHSITVVSGVFNAHIGDPSSCSDILDYNFSANQDVYLQVDVSSNGSSFEELTPRQRIGASAFALTAGSLFGTTTQSLIGTTTPVANSLLTIEATTTTAVPLTLKGFYEQTANIFQIQDAANNDFVTVSSSGSVGVGTSTPWGTFSVEHITSSNPAAASFVVADSGTSTPSFIVLNQNGFVGIATRTPGTALGVAGAIVATAKTYADTFQSTSASGINTFPIASTTSLSVGNLLDVDGTGTSTFDGGGHGYWFTVECCNICNRFYQLHRTRDWR